MGSRHHAEQGRRKSGAAQKTSRVRRGKCTLTLVSADSALPKDQAASARNGLGYAYLTEGNVSEAIMQTSKAVKAGDQGAVKQLQAIKISSEKAAH
jgi:Tfp pilus assembly protein PilF